MKLYIFILTILPLFCFSQTNLLLNGDFEDYSSCPIGYSDPGQSPNYEINKCIGWTNPTYGTSDYYNQCANGTFAGITSNPLGYQQPYSGNGYLGTYFTSYGGGAGWDGYNGNMWWEYIQGEIITPLSQDNLYNIKLHISLANASDLAINEFGIYFSADPINSQNSASLNVTPQVVFTNNNYFKDTINWISLEGVYIAQGGENYITIGNFNDDIATDTLRVYFPIDEVEEKISYYFIDKIEIINSTEELPISNVFTPNGDGINDEWKLPNLPNYEVIIYNRWGNKIISRPAINFAWNGKTTNGDICSNGVYYYIIQNIHSKANTYKGFIQLLN
ncbi:MAG: gliding motility-associated C-terminal domain-containing protein [Flavobacteriales bacterium]|nr:gliding motility-associated C-terminal domain-containing protein [Flavobacteriales bacterium]